MSIYVGDAGAGDAPADAAILKRIGDGDFGIAVIPQHTGQPSPVSLKIKEHGRRCNDGAGLGARRI